MTSAVGPLPRFAEVHVKRALELIAEHKTIGRKQLAKKLGVGEGSMRTILNQLKKQSLITSSRGGHALTAKGRRALGKPLEYVQVDAGDLTVGEVDVATIVRGAATKVKRGIEQRDEAIKAGADGATVLIFKAGELRFPDGFAKVNENVEKLIKMFRPREGDVVIVGTGRDAAKAEAGAKAAARSLVKTRLARYFRRP
jgi:DNA-binding PadR family transcriptional regulator